jgi:hypothetical protein
MSQIFDKVEFVTPSGMYATVVHEGDVFKVIKIVYRPSGLDLHCDVKLERMKNNSGINRTE